MKAFAADKLKLDYSIESFKDIDAFFDQYSENGHAVASGRLANSTGNTLFSIGSYIGETLKKMVPGTVWITNDDDPQAEINASLQLPNREIIWPIQKAIKRFKNGQEDCIYDYGIILTAGYKTTSNENKKSWWNFMKKN